MRSLNIVAIGLAACLTLIGCQGGRIGLGVPVVPGVSVGVGVGTGGVSVGAGVGSGPVGVGVSVHESGRVSAGGGVGVSAGPVGVGTRVDQDGRVSAGAGVGVSAATSDGARANAVTSQSTVIYDPAVRAEMSGQRAPSGWVH